MKFITNKVKLYPNKTQTSFLELTIEMCRQMYNTLLYYTYSIYSKFSLQKQSDPNFDLVKFSSTHKIPNIGVIKKKNDMYKKVDSLALCNEYSNMVRGLHLFYNGHSKKPKFKSKYNNKLSYTTHQVNDNIRFEGKKLRLPKVGFIKARGIRQFPKCFKIKYVTVFKDTRGYFFASVVYEYSDNYFYDKKDKTWKEGIPNNDIECTDNIVENKSKDNDLKRKFKIVGLDFKINNIFVSSDNFSPKYSQKYFFLISQISIIQKKLNKKRKKSKNYYKLLDKLRKIHRKIVNIRHDLQRKVSSYIADNYYVAVIEDISMKQVAKDLQSGKNTYNTAFNSFIKKLSQKLNGTVIKINKWFPSSKMCSKCRKC